MYPYSKYFLSHNAKFHTKSDISTLDTLFRMGYAFYTLGDYHLYTYDKICVYVRIFITIEKEVLL